MKPQNSVTEPESTLVEKVRENEGSSIEILLNRFAQPVAVNQAVRSFLAASRLIRWQDLFAAEDVGRWESSIRTATTDRVPLRDCFLLQRFDKAICQFAIRAEPKFNRQGSYTGHLVSGIDITGLLSSADTTPSSEPSFSDESNEAAKWHDQLVAVSTIVKACTDQLPEMVAEPVPPDLAALIVRLQSAGNTLRETVLELSSISRGTTAHESPTEQVFRTVHAPGQRRTTC